MSSGLLVAKSSVLKRIGDDRVNVDGVETVSFEAMLVAHRRDDKPDSKS